MFTITKDHIAEEGEQSREGLTIDSMPQYGMERAMGLDDSLPNEGATIPFRLYDDDGELHYEGELTDDDACTNQLAALRFGETDTGCTMVKVRRNGKWELEIG